MRKFDRYIDKLDKLLALYRANFNHFEDKPLSFVKLSNATAIKFTLEGIVSFGELVKLNAEKIFLLLDKKLAAFKKLFSSLNRYYGKIMFETEHSDWEHALCLLLDELKEKDEEFLKNQIPFDVVTSTRLKNALIKNKITTLKDLSKLSISDLLNIDQMGKKTFVDLSTVLEQVLHHDFDFKNQTTPIIEVVSSKNSLIEKLSSQTDDFLDQYIQVDPDYIRLFNVLSRCGIYRFRDIITVGTDIISMQKGCGRQTIKDLYIVVDNAIAEYKIHNSGTPSNLNRFLDTFKKKWSEDIDINSFSVDPGYEFLRVKLLKALEKAADIVLPRREAAVFKLRHCEQKSQTLEKIGNKLYITRERVRQIDVKASDKMRRTFINPSNLLSFEPVVEFYFTLLFVGEDKLVEFIYYLIQNDGFEGELIKKELIKSGIVSRESSLFKERTITPEPQLPKGAEAILKKIKGTKFIKTVFNYEGLKAFDDTEINTFKTDNPAPKKVVKLFSSMSANREYISVYGKPVVDGKNYDASVIIADKYVVLVNIFEKIDDLLSKDIIESESETRKYCKRNGIGCSYLLTNFRSLHTFRSTHSKPNVEALILNDLRNNKGVRWHNINFIVDQHKTTTNKVIGIGIRNGLCFDFNPLSVWYEDQMQYQQADLMREIEYINESSFDNEELMVIGAVYQIAHNYLKGDKELWFGTIRVYLQGYQGSHLYNECKGMKYFGAIKQSIKSTRLKAILNRFADLKVLKAKVNRNDKTYYILNENMVRLSKLQKVI